ncbi:MAG: DUF1007 family protein [Candidatus Fermentibacteraceae bacterium]
MPAGELPRNRPSDRTRWTGGLRTAWCAALACAMALPGGAEAHPHMFVDARLAVVMQGDRVAGLEMTWFFDPLFTSSIVSDYDRDGDGAFSSGEVRAIRDNAFQNLRNFDYFTYVETGGETFSPDTVEEFTAYMSGDTLAYRFYLPFDIPVREDAFAVAIYDRSFYCDILYHPEDPVLIRGPGCSGADWEIVEDRDTRIQYEGSVSVSRSGRSYGGTAYPQQVVVSLGD